MKRVILLILILTISNYSQIINKISNKLEVNNKTRNVVATGYCLRGKMANGQRTRNGVVAADPRVFPLGTRLLISGQQYIVADTGGAIKGNRIDIWMSSCSQAIIFGKRNIKVQVI